MLKIAIATIVSIFAMVMGYENGAVAWIGAAVICAILETAIFNNVIFFVPSAVGGAGAFAQFFLGDATTAVIAAGAAGVGVVLLMFKELTHDKKAEEQAKLASMKKVRGY